MSKGEIVSYVAVLLGMGLALFMGFGSVHALPEWKVIFGFSGFISLVLTISAISRVATSTVSDVAKPLWVAVAILFPLLGAVSVFVVLNDLVRQSKE